MSYDLPLKNNMTVPKKMTLVPCFAGSQLQNRTIKVQGTEGTKSEIKIRKAYLAHLF